MKRGMTFKALARKRAELHIDGYIGDWGITAAGLRQQLDAAGEITDLDVHLNSGGGSVIEGLNIYNLLKRHQANITVYIGGIAASMGSVIAMAGDLISIPKNALMMVHNPWGGAIGDADELRKVADILDKMKTSLVSIYADRSGLDTEQLNQLLTDETWLNGEEAVELGLADEVEGEIVDDEELAAMEAVKDFHCAPLRQETQKLVASADKGALAEFKQFEDGHFDLVFPEPAPAATDTVPQTITVNLTGSAAAKAFAESLQAGTQFTPSQPGGTAAPEPQATEEDSMTKEEAQAALKERNDAVIQMFAKHTQLAELKTDILADPSVTVEQAKDKLLEALGKDQRPHGGVQVIDDAGDKALKGMGSAILVRAGLEKRDDEANEYRGYTLLEMARNVLRLRGATPNGDKMAVIAQAFTHSTGDFGNLLSNTANKAMLKGFMEAPEIYPEFTGVGNLPDFKVNERVDIGHAPSLREVRAGAEYKHITLGDKGEQAQLATYGELFGITRQAIINDDLGAFTRIPSKFGQAARRTVGDLVFEVLIASGNFSAANSITSAALNSDNVDKLRTKLATQKDGAGKVTTPVRPAFLLLPEALLGKGKQTMEAEYIVDDAAKDARQPNTVRNLAKPLSDYRLDAKSATTWYLIGDPAIYDALDVLYLDGNANPFLEQQDGWNVDGAEFKVRIDAAAKLWDKRSVGRGQA